MAQAKYSLLITFVAIAVLAIGGLYLARQGVQRQKYEQEMPPAVQAPAGKTSTSTNTNQTEVEAINESFALVEYQDASLGFSLSYPEVWHLARENNNLIFSPLKKEVPFTQEEKGKGAELPLLTLSIDNNPKGLTPEEWFRSRYLPENTLEAFVEDFNRIDINKLRGVRFRDTLAFGTPMVYIVTSAQNAYIFMQYTQSKETEALIESFNLLEDKIR